MKKILLFVALGVMIFGGLSWAEAQGGPLVRKPVPELRVDVRALGWLGPSILYDDMPEQSKGVLPFSLGFIIPFDRESKYGHQLFLGFTGTTNNSDLFWLRRPGERYEAVASLKDKVSRHLSLKFGVGRGKVKTIDIGGHQVADDYYRGQGEVEILFSFLSKESKSDKDPTHQANLFLTGFAHGLKLEKGRTIVVTGLQGTLEIYRLFNSRARFQAFSGLWRDNRLSALLGGGRIKVQPTTAIRVGMAFMFDWEYCTIGPIFEALWLRGTDIDNNLEDYESGLAGVRMEVRVPWW